MKVAILGCGGMGRLHGQMAANCGHEITVCADPFINAARAMAETFGADALDDPFAAIRRPDVDIVGIMTPTPMHASLVIAAAQAGKAILCEKPFTRTLEQGKEALAAVKKAGVKLFVAHVLRYFHEFEAMKAQVEAGKVGKVGFVKMYRGGIFPSNPWFQNYEESGGVAFDSSIHDVDWLRYMFGEVDHVYAQAIQRTKPFACDYAMMTFRMKCGIIANVIGTWAHPQGFRVRTEICGEHGIIQYSSEDAPISAAFRRGPGEGPGMIVPGSPVSISPYQLEWEDFTNWLLGKSEPRVTAQDGYEAIRMVNAALTSAKTGRPVKL